MPAIQKQAAAEDYRYNGADDRLRMRLFYRYHSMDFNDPIWKNTAWVTIMNRFAVHFGISRARGLELLELLGVPSAYHAKSPSDLPVDESTIANLYHSCAIESASYCHMEIYLAAETLPSASDDLGLIRTGLRQLRTALCYPIHKKLPDGPFTQIFISSVSQKIRSGCSYVLGAPKYAEKFQRLALSLYLDLDLLYLAKSEVCYPRGNRWRHWDHPWPTRESFLQLQRLSASAISSLYVSNPDVHQLNPNSEHRAFLIKTLHSPQFRILSHRWNGGFFQFLTELFTAARTLVPMAPWRYDVAEVATEYFIPQQTLQSLLSDYNVDLGQIRQHYQELYSNLESRAEGCAELAKWCGLFEFRNKAHLKTFFTVVDETVARLGLAAVQEYRECLKFAVSDAVFKPGTQHQFFRVIQTLANDRILSRYCRYCVRTMCIAYNTNLDQLERACGCEHLCTAGVECIDLKHRSFAKLPREKGVKRRKEHRSKNIS